MSDGGIVANVARMYKGMEREVLMVRTGSACSRVRQVNHEGCS